MSISKNLLTIGFFSLDVHISQIDSLVPVFMSSKINSYSYSFAACSAAKFEKVPSTNVEEEGDDGVDNEPNISAVMASIVGKKLDPMIQDPKHFLGRSWKNTHKSEKYYI